MNHKLKSRLSGEISTTSDTWDDTHGRKQGATKEPLDKGEKEEWKSWLKVQHSKTKIMSSCPITSWQMDGEKVETVTDFIFLASKIIAEVTVAIKIACFLEGKLWQT